ncbi:phosphatidate cytidylyltransferase [Chloroflexia bacterium SDU3-3]|nr:phosphatidate cytidylyltransferase [Chloroflexia bacterium SDU3-3]
MASAAVLLPVIIIIVWWNYWAMSLVLGAVVVLALLELYGTYTHGGYRPHTWVGIAGALGLVASVALRPILGGFDLLGLVITLLIAGSLTATLSRSSEERGLASWALTVAGAIYVGWMYSFVLSLRLLETPLRPSFLAGLGLPSGAAWLFGVMAITWLQDTFAYFVGKRFGKHKMAPALSPKKTWEGAAGGMLGAFAGALAGIYLFCLPLSLPQAALLALVGGVVGPVGDLAESLMKRQVGLKDAGNIIPGHGGLLDRSDSLLFTAPILYYIILLLHFH